MTAGPSGATSYVVVGANAGPSKLRKIQEKGIKTLSEDGFFQLIRDRSGKKLDGKAKAALEKEEEKARESVRAMEKEEKRIEKELKDKEREMKKKGIFPPVKSVLFPTPLPSLSLSPCRA